MEGQSSRLQSKVFRKHLRELANRRGLHQAVRGGCDRRLSNDPEVVCLFVGGLATPSTTVQTDILERQRLLQYNSNLSFARLFPGLTMFGVGVCERGRA